MDKLFVILEAGKDYELPTKNQKVLFGNHIQAVLSMLTPKEAKVIRMRFGIGEHREHTLREVGKHMVIGRERVRQIQIKALAKLKHPSRRQEMGKLHRRYKNGR